MQILRRIKGRKEDWCASSIFPTRTKMTDRMTFWLAVVSVALQASVSWAGPYVKSEEVAPYNVIQKNEKYEIRTYLPSKWVCYEYRGAVFSKRDQAMAFVTLFDYSSGDNTEGVNITETAPTTVGSVVSTDNPDQTLYQMCQYLPKMHQENPPEPLESDVIILHRNEFTVAVRQFNHYMMKENEWEVQMEIFKNDLIAAGEPNIDFDDFYGAAYDAPFDVNGRPNEVWFGKKE